MKQGKRGRILVYDLPKFYPFYLCTSTTFAIKILKQIANSSITDQRNKTPHSFTRSRFTTFLKEKTNRGNHVTSLFFGLAKQSKKKEKGLVPKSIQINVG